LDKWVSLHIRKKLINLAVRILNKLVPSRDPAYPQTRLLEDVYKKLLQAYKLEVFCGRFDDVPYQALQTLKDRHFLNVLELSGKVLMYLGDTDRYYRQWLGLFLLVTHDVIDSHARALTPEEASREINGQWGDYGGINEEVLSLLFPEHRDLAQEMVLCNHLHNLVTVNCNREKSL
jgi:hypothetical protein